MAWKTDELLGILHAGKVHEKAEEWVITNYYREIVARIGDVDALPCILRRI